MKLIELHILQSFPVTCLNRDDVGAPKSAIFGGVARARVSSQSWKRAIRKLASELLGQRSRDLFAGSRSRLLADRLRVALQEAGLDETQAREKAEEIVAALGEHDETSTAPFKTKVLLYFSPQELTAIAQAMAQDPQQKWDKGSLKKAIKHFHPKDLVDIALFGRMVANDPSLTIEGACLFSHALSTHRVDNDIDFFAAVDDLRPEESEGAGHLGTLEFNAACYYRYIGINVDLLRDEDHVGHLPAEETREVLGSFLRASMYAVPGGRKNTMFGHNPPCFVLGLVRTGQPLSLVNAFERPVPSRGDGYIEPSIGAIKEHYEVLKNAYKLEADVEVCIPDKDIDRFCKEILENV